ncbi:hypothetical protein [Streptomyces sp. BH055]|uniref:hypothetical protein n=1 Tax=unclassified Streptomyces TaxID=2593676 RepID=UPI003BB4B48D
MTSSHVQTDNGVAALPPAKRHLRLNPEAQTFPTEAGRFVVPLVEHGGHRPADPHIPLVLTADDVVALREQLGGLFPPTGDGDER